MTRSGFLDTGLVICVRPCLSDEACSYKDAKGKRINDAQVICPAKRLLTRKRGQTYNIYVVLQKLQTVDIESLFKTPGVQFSVVLPAPSAVSAVLDKYGCPKLIVTFSTKVIGTSGDSCGDYFTAPTLIDDEDKCLLLKGSNRMLIEFKTPIEAGGDLIFKPGVISSAAEHHTDDQLVEKLTGSVTVTNDDTEEKGKPIVKIDSQTMKKVGCSPVTVKLKIRNLGCWDIVVNWIVSATGADAAHVTSLQEKLGTSTSFTITGSDLQEGVPYIFTAKWTAGKYSGEDSTTIIKDSDSTAAVKIRGIMEDDTDINEALVIKAKLSLCDGDKSIPAITWSLTPPDYSLEPKFKTFIPKGQLKPRTQYNLTCKVTRDGASEINRFVAFKTRPLPIKPLIETITGRPTYDDTVTLTCSDIFDTAADKSDYEYSWSCNDNVITGTEDENDFRPCFEYSDADKKYIPIERSGHTISLGKSDRMQPRNGLNLIQIWTCEMRRKSEMDLIYRSSQKLEFSEELIQLQVPEIDSKTPEMIYLSEDDSFVVKIHAKVRKGTGCKWWTNDMDDRSEASENILLDPTNFRISGRLGKENIKYSETSYEMCHIKLNLHDANLIPAQRYVLKLFAYNKDSKFLVLNSREFKVMVVPHPKPGIIKIEADDDTIIALKTKVRILLSGWQDDLNDAALQCNFYYTNLDSQVKQIRRMNTVPINIDEQKETTLSEGRNKIEVECCNIFNKCSRKEADEIITADPIDQEEVLNVISTTLPQLLSLDTEGVLSFVAELKKSMKKKVVDVVKKENAEKSLKQAMQKAIKRAFETARDITSKLSALQQTVDVVDSPADLDEGAKEDVKQNVKAILEEAVGTDKRRKKRSTTETSKPKGLTASAASIGLKALDSLISKETITQEDANFFKTVVDEVMVAMCINFTGSEPWLAPAELSYVRLHKTNLDGYASIQSDVSCSTCPEVDYPAKVNYGSYLESYFNDSWQCTFYDKCIDVCVATAQINIDYVSFTAKTEVVAPTRRSDIIILKMISPENYAVEELTSLSTPIEATLTINGTMDMDKYDYKCLMWVSDNWSDQQCNITIPSIDLTASQHTAVCTCNALGIISIFQEVKQEQVVTTTTQSTTTITTTVVSSSKDTNTVSSTNTPPPSKQMKDSTTSVKVEFTFVDDYDTAVGNSVSAFNNKVKEDIVTGTGINSNCIKNFKSEKGSIVISFELQQAGSSLTLGQIVYKVENAIKTDAITFTTPSGGSLSIKAGSFGYDEVEDDDDDKEDGDGNESGNLPIIIGAALGGLVIVCVTIIVILLVLKSKKKRTHPTRSVSDGPTPRYATPPPTYSVTQPPPPYLYEDPPKVNKWIEDELNETKLPLDNQRPPSSGSGGSGSSYELKLKKKGRECGPTPVGE
ncbi:uncharacterized protein LOC132726338 [Ruditapes philippinarum]|uniref:uncharacterized protein LOC132726338 n=1 Tax=Ruditapes philippinarum TaxID=129788 RepID=UPI00295B8FE3|nr:uncharacterized protein LOC132726338 [Ruditapes philippinarum]